MATSCFEDITALNEIALRNIFEKCKTEFIETFKSNMSNQYMQIRDNICKVSCDRYDVPEFVFPDPEDKKWKGNLGGPGTPNRSQNPEFYPPIVPEEYKGQVKIVYAWRQIRETTNSPNSYPQHITNDDRVVYLLNNGCIIHFMSREISYTNQQRNWGKFCIYNIDKPSDEITCTCPNVDYEKNVCWSCLLKTQRGPVSQDLIDILKIYAHASNGTIIPTIRDINSYVNHKMYDLIKNYYEKSKHLDEAAQLISDMHVTTQYLRELESDRQNWELQKQKDREAFGTEVKMWEEQKAAEKQALEEEKRVWNEQKTKELTAMREDDTQKFAELAQKLEARLNATREEYYEKLEDLDTEREDLENREKEISSREEILKICQADADTLQKELTETRQRLRQKESNLDATKKSYEERAEALTTRYKPQVSADKLTIVMTKFLDVIDGIIDMSSITEIEKNNLMRYRTEFAKLYKN